MDVDGQAAVGDQLTTDGGSAQLSDGVRWRMGALQPMRHSLLGIWGLVTDTRQSSSAMRTHGGSFVHFFGQGRQISTQPEYFISKRLVCVGLIDVATQQCRHFMNKTLCVLHRGVAELCSNDGGCLLFVVSLIAPAHHGVSRMSQGRAEHGF